MQSLSRGLTLLETADGGPWTVHFLRPTVYGLPSHLVTCGSGN